MEESTPIPSSSEQSNNVVLFPNIKRGDVPATVDEIINSVNNMKILHVDETCQFVINTVIDYLQSGGFDLKLAEDEQNIKEVAFLAETLKSLLYKYYNIEHPLQTVASEMFETIGNGMVKFKTGSIKCDIKLSEEEVENK